MAEREQRLRLFNAPWGIQRHVPQGWQISMHLANWEKGRPSSSPINSLAKGAPFSMHHPDYEGFSSVIILLGRFARTSRKTT
jgi:hypothetical protein